MSDILSQEEIDLLLRGESDNADNNSVLSSEEVDTIGEVGNISMGTAATTLSTLLGKKVTITAPFVEETTLAKLAKQHPIPFVAVEVSYKEGLEGKNLLVIRENDVKIITDLILGGDGEDTKEELNEMHLSAIGEVMNQMIGSASTSLSTLLGKTISISPPNAFVIKFGDEESYRHFISDDATIAQVKFKMVVEGLIDSYIMQLLPIDFAKGLVSSLVNAEEAEENYIDTQNTVNVGMDNNIEDESIQSTEQYETNFHEPDESVPNKADISESQLDKADASESQLQNEDIVNVRPVSFQPLEEIASDEPSDKNIQMIMDVPLQVSVELGRTKKLIKEILELSTGSVIELDRMAGEPVDILVNEKLVAKGEVVVIDENFGVRISDIVSQKERINNLR
mgnify:FL=1